MDYKYRWTKSFSIPAQVVGEFFYSLPEKSPEAFVKASRSPKAPTHSMFEWDDSAAASAYRLVQARIIVNSLEVEIVSKSTKPSHVRAYIGSSERGNYVATLEASDEELSAAEQKCLEQMRNFRQRYKSIELAKDVINAIQFTEAKVARKRKAA